MRGCWNRQTGTFEVRVSYGVGVQVPSLAPSKKGRPIGRPFLLGATKYIPCGICEIRFACEMLPRNVKCAAAREGICFISLSASAENFTMTEGYYFTFAVRRIFHFPFGQNRGSRFPKYLTRSNQYRNGVRFMLGRGLNRRITYAFLLLFIDLIIELCYSNYRTHPKWTAHACCREGIL